MDTLIFALNAILPILLLIGLGYILKKAGFLSENFLKIGNKFIFRVALPVLLFVTIYDIDNISEINWSIIIYAVISIIILFFVGLIIATIFIKDKRQKGPILQAVFRANYAIIGIPLAEGLGGDKALEVVALITAIAVPLINILAVISLTMFVRTEDDNKHPIKTTLIKIAKNPLIISIFLGLVALLIRNYFPGFTIKGDITFFYTALVKVKEMASPLALIILGGTFEFLIIKDMIREISIGTFSRVVIAPLITLTLAVFLSEHTSFFNFSAIEYPALIALLASPTAISGAVMAREFKNDEKLAVQLVVWTSTLSIITLFIIVYIMRSLALI